MSELPLRRRDRPFVSELGPNPYLMVACACSQCATNRTAMGGDPCLRMGCGGTMGRIHFTDGLPQLSGLQDCGRCGEAHYGTGAFCGVCDPAQGGKLNTSSVPTNDARKTFTVKSGYLDGASITMTGNLVRTAKIDDIVPDSKHTVGQLKAEVDGLAYRCQKLQREATLATDRANEACASARRELTALRERFKERLEEERSENAFLMRELKRHDPRLVAARSKNKTA